VTRGVFEILWERLDPGEFAKLMDHLPASLRTLRTKTQRKLTRPLLRSAGSMRKSVGSLTERGNVR